MDEIVEFKPKQEYVDEISCELSVNRNKLIEVMKPREFNHVTALIETCPSLTRKAVIYKTVREAYQRGYSFDTAKTLTDIIQIYNKFLIERRNGR